MPFPGQDIIVMFSITGLQLYLLDILKVFANLDEILYWYFMCNLLCEIP